MRVNKRKIPVRIMVNDIAIGRLSPLHPKYQLIVSDTKKYQAGYNGEKKLDYILNLEKSNKFYNLQDMRLELEYKFFQMDSVVLSPSFIVDFETKNWSGVLKYDTLNKQVLQYHDGRLTDIYPDPVLQSQQHLVQLKYWLEKYNFKVPPLESIVVMSNPETILNFDSHNESTAKIIYPHAALDKILELQRIYKTPILSSKDLNSISKTMIEKHTPEEYNVLKKYGLSANDILPGVRCHRCKELSMVWKYRTWYCPTCDIHSAKAHEPAILEYLLLHSTITPEQCRNFLRIPDGHKNLITKFLMEMNLQCRGNTRNREYFLPIKKLIERYWTYKQQLRDYKKTT